MSKLEEKEAYRANQKPKSYYNFFLLFGATIIAVIIALILYPANNNAPIEKNGDVLCRDCNLIIFAVTNLRYDHLSHNGYFRNTSPNIDNFAKESVVFDSAFSQSSWTLPSGISFFTSLYPFTHKIMNRNVSDYLNEGIVTLADVLEKHEYKTAAFTGGFDYGDEYGFIPRFDYFVNSGGRIISTDPGSNSSITQRYGYFSTNFEKATEWLQKNKDNKFLLFFQGFDAHCPFGSPRVNDVYDKGYTGRLNFSFCYWTFDKIKPIVINNKPFYNLKTDYTASRGIRDIRINERDVYHMEALYDGEIVDVDKLFHEFLDEIGRLGLEENTIIVLFSEHGDLFGEHGRFMRGGPIRGTFYEEVLHTPLIIKHPNLKPKRIEGFAQLIDVMPTLLDFLGIKKEEYFEGKSLLPLISENKEVNAAAIAGTTFIPYVNNTYFNQTSIVQSVRTKDFKLIYERLYTSDKSSYVDSYEFYNLSSDPKELNNIYLTADPGLVSGLKEKLRVEEMGLE